MKRVLLTGMSGTGKSSVIHALSVRGFKAVDTDDGWCEPSPDGRQRWREDVIGRLRPILCVVVHVDGPAAGGRHRVEGLLQRGRAGVQGGQHQAPGVRPPQQRRQRPLQVLRLQQHVSPGDADPRARQAGNWLAGVARELEGNAGRL